MKLALIPPLSLINTVRDDEYKLALAQLFYNWKYDEVYGKPKNDNFVILDNGAAEGFAIEPEVLAGIADRVQPNEVVLPDTLGDANDTLRKVKHFFHYTGWSQAHKYMAVVQGQRWSEVVSLITAYSFIPQITTIGIPRHLMRTWGWDQARLEVVDHIIEQYPGRFQIHLLGTEAGYLGELTVAKRVYGPKIRGVDTSAPYVFAYHGMRIESGMSGSQDFSKHVPKVERPLNYFEMPALFLKKDLLQHNIDTLKSWVNDDRTGTVEAGCA